MPVMTSPPTERQADRAVRGETGQVLVIFTLFIVVLLGAAALTIDYGNWLKVRRDYQNVADAAVLEGARFLTRPLSTDCAPSKSKYVCAREAAWASFQRQLGLTFALGESAATLALDNVVDKQVGNYRLTVAAPASAALGKYPGSATGNGTVFAFIEADNATFFSRVLGRNQQTISAWATASSRSGRFAVITLRKIGEDGPNDANDISINGNNSQLIVRNGDVGGNWGLAISGAGASLTFQSDTGDSYQALLADPRQTAPVCCSWTPSQVINGTVDYMAEVPDPDYPLPPGITLQPPAASSLLPPGDHGGIVDVKQNPPTDKAPGGTEVVGGVLKCKADSPRIGPGYYTRISIDADKCLILDPTVHHTRIVESGVDSPSPVPDTESPGIFYVNGSITVGPSAMLVGDGVTLIIRPGDSSSTATKLDIKNNGVVAVNTGATPGGAPAKTLGGWYWNVANQTAWSPYSLVGGLWVYNPLLEPDINNRGIAVYVPRRNQYQTGVAVDNNSNVLNNLASGAAMVWKGVIYAPHDNVTFAGQVGYDAVGQLVAWTVKFTGSTAVTQDYAGPEQALPYLIEPKIGQ